MTVLLDGARPEWVDREFFLSLNLAWTQHRSEVVRGILKGPQKYLRRVRPNTHQMLFNLDEDPAEIHNLNDQQEKARRSLARTLDAYLATKSVGVHLKLVNDGADAGVACHAVLRTEGRFTEVFGSMLEEGDAFELSDDHRTLKLRCRLENRPHPTGGFPHYIIDRDGLVFLVSPADAPIVVEELGLEDGRALTLRVGPDREAMALPFTLSASTRKWAVRDVEEILREEGTPPRRADMGAYLAVVLPPIERAGLSPEIRDRLRALGYLGDDGQSE